MQIKKIMQESHIIPFLSKIMEDMKKLVDDKDKLLDIAKDTVISFLFILFSCISFLLTLLLNKLVIFILDNNIKEKKFLYGIGLIFSAANILSFILYGIHSLAIKKKVKKIENVNTNINIEKQNEKNTYEEINQKSENKESKLKQIKTGTCCGYLIIRKEMENHDIIIFSKYMDKWPWFKKNFLNKIVVIIVAFEIISQLNSFAFKQILSERMLNNFSDTKNIVILSIYIIIGCIFGSIASLTIPFAKTIKKGDNKNVSINFIIIFIPAIYFMVCFIVHTFLLSLIYYILNNHKTCWDYIFIYLLSYFNIFDLYIFGLFGFFQGSSVVDASFILNFERLIWTIIENLIDNFDVKKRNLVLAQFIFSSLLIGAPIVIACLLVYSQCFYQNLTNYFQNQINKMNDENKNEENTEKNTENKNEENTMFIASISTIQIK